MNLKFLDVCKKITRVNPFYEKFVQNHARTYQNIFGIFELLLELFDTIILQKEKKIVQYNAEIQTSKNLKMPKSRHFFSQPKCRNPG